MYDSTFGQTGTVKLSDEDAAVELLTIVETVVVVRENRAAWLAMQQPN